MNTARLRLYCLSAIIALLAEGCAPASDLPKPPVGSKWDQVKGILSTYNDVPIDFYGKLEDQFGNPVTGAEIKGTIRVISGARQGTDQISTTSDASGLFVFHGKGQEIGMTPQKSGYALASTATFFKYSRLEDKPHLPDPSNPTVIKMWKLQGPERLISFNIETYIPCDGTPVAFDLQRGERATNGGDVIITVESPSAPSLRDGYNWKARIEPIEGGLVQPAEIRFDQMRGAPEAGYAASFDIRYQYGLRPWSSRFKSAFYFKSRGGKCYGKFNVAAISDVVKDGAVLLRLSGVLNPAGSRNLEEDPALVTAAHP